MVLITLTALFAELSVLAFGGGNTILPEMQRQVVTLHHWMTARNFTALYALAQAAPGPNMMIVALVGWRVARWSGVLAVLAATFGPSSIIAAIVLRLWGRYRNRPWRRPVQAGLVPMTIGLVAASAAVIARSADRSVLLVCITLAGAGLSMTARLHPLCLLAGGAAISLASIWL